MNYDPSCSCFYPILSFPMDFGQLQRTMDALVDQVSTLTQKIEEDKAVLTESHCVILKRLDRLDQTLSSKAKEKAQKKREIVEKVDKWMLACEACNLSLIEKVKDEDKVTKEELELEMKSLDTKILHEQLNKKCAENKELQEKIQLLQHQLIVVKSEVPSSIQKQNMIEDIGGLKQLNLERVEQNHMILDQKLSKESWLEDYMGSPPSYLYMQIKSPNSKEKDRHIKRTRDINSTESSFLPPGENDMDIKRKAWRIYHRRRRKSKALINSLHY